jgi:hypothetical protein
MQYFLWWKHLTWNQFSEGSAISYDIHSINSFTAYKAKENLALVHHCEIIYLPVIIGQDPGFHRDHFHIQK